ncbi:MAG: hypothetical protein MUP48_01555 [Wolbachia endosymbiont of Homalodisca vitripennis]|uniref:hypothetical protein n=1 Tax=Wolbachia endosymbiont of Rhagoletis cingulata TaxID=1220542 RepID=UPI001BBD1F8C|nr:hypothetical protein [Wolbachia endosymbiont of Homalodisca vitripennis]MCJ7454128.1 hypothetical protein [Wolbachia endosymbiont of Homalodisca vitripennis]MCJ7475486.1 hypothetical protein [Wolbachia endosymbiont of Homalodisca vitripennis]
MTNLILNPPFEWKALHDCYRECEEKSPGQVTAERNNCEWYCRLKDTHGLFKSDSQEESTLIDISSTLREIGNKFCYLADSVSVL